VNAPDQPAPAPEARPEAQPGFYADPVVYDILHAPGTTDEARVLTAIAREHAGHNRLLTFLEPACGTARHLRVLARHGHRCVGFDRSEAMIDDAKARAERAGLARKMDLFVADMVDFAGRVTRPVDAAFNLINTFRHLPDDDAAVAHLGQVARCLTERGVYVVGLSVTDYDLEQPSEDVWVGGRGPLRVTQTVNYIPPTPPDRAERVLSHLHIAGPSGEEHRDSAYALRTYSKAEWEALIERSPMRVERVLDDAGFAIDPPRLGYALFVLRAR
jgi:SAM-dependent methyltransferase